MTINTELGRKQYLANGSTSTFTFNSTVEDATHLLVETLDTLTPGASSVTKTLGTDYSVSGAGATSTSVDVTFGTNPANGIQVTISRNIPKTQLNEYTANDPFPALTHMSALDKLTLIDQQQQDQLDRSLAFPTSADSTLVPSLPIAPVADAVLAWNGTTGALKNGPTVAEVTAASGYAAQTALDAAQTAADRVQTGLDVASSAANALAAQSAVVGTANEWAFDSSTTMGDPGTGKVRFNNATISSVTALAFNAQSDDTGNPNLRGFILTWDDINNAIASGILRIDKDATNFAIFSVTYGGAVDNTSWVQLTVSYRTGQGSFTAADKLYVGFTPAGQDGLGYNTNAALNAIAGVTPAANKIPMFSSGTAATELDLDTDGTLAANSDTKVASQKAVRDYVDTKVAAIPSAPKNKMGVIAASGTWTTSVNITTSTVFKFTVIGAGAGGANATVTAGSVGGGGGAGGCAIYVVSGLSPSTGYSVTIGAGGTGNLSGGNTSITIGATTVTANGGATGGTGVACPETEPGGAGGTATNGTLNLTGASGGNGISISTSVAISGEGAPSILGGGGVAVKTIGSNGNPGTAYGSGGSGAVRSGSNASGGTGANGVVIVEWIE